MRSVKLLVAMAVMAAFVAGPVLAQDATGGAAPAPAGSDTMKPAGKSHAKHHGKKHHAKSGASSSSSAPASTPAQ